jgi:alpha-L-rhamnosidase
MKTHSTLGKVAAAALFGALVVPAMAPAQNSADPLEQGFLSPPNGARPRVWWHWMSGNITEEGIGLDMEWMKRVGLGGMQNFDAALNTPKVVEKRLVYMTPEWKEAFLFATKKADSLGLELAIAGSPGWSETGGPWVESSQAMKKFVWSETAVEGGHPFAGTIAKPPMVTGPFQNLAQQDPMGMMGGPGQQPPPPKDYYADSVVIAYRVPDAEVSSSPVEPKVTSSSGHVDPAILAARDMMKSTDLPIAPVGQKAWIQFEYPEPHTIDAVTVSMGGPRDPLAQFAGETGHGPVVEASDDGQQFRSIVTIPTAGAVQHTMAFAPVTARFFRLTFTTLEPQKSMLGDIDLSDLGISGMPPPPTDYHISEFELHSGARINRFEEKAGFATLPDLYSFATPSAAAGQAIQKTTVVDLTAKMHPDGTLDWTPPPGHWIVQRMGYSLTGITNHPASPEATGLEVDKLNRDHVKTYFEHYLDNYKGAVGPLMGKTGVRFVVTDSWEAGTENWTDEMLAEFVTRRGYDAHPWLPVLTGHVVESAEASDRFLWDWRKTLADLVAENHYGQIAQSLHARGMGQYGESHEEGRATIGDGMEMKKADDVPMAAMWTQRPGVNAEQYGYNADIRESASVSHIYGQNLVAAESLTAASSPWAWSPATLKPTADKELAVGLNRFVIHTSVHQPLVNKAPGLALGPFGQWFTRNEVWAEQAQPWITYLARSSFLLQQGHFVADILYFYGEDSNLTAIFGSKSPDVPLGYNFDYVNADALIHKLSVKNGQLVTASGMSYRVLALDAYSQHMSLPVLRKVRDLVLAGAIVVGACPVNDPSLADDAAEFHSISDQLWRQAKTGKGKVYGDQKLPDVLAGMKVPLDFAYSKPNTDTEVLFVHRRLEHSDLYYVDNRNDRVEQVDATFRVEGKVPELWHADTGMMEPAAYRIASGSTTVPLHLDPYGTVFVVFRKPSSSPSLDLPAKSESAVATVEGPWEISFEADRGAPERITLDKLVSWSDSTDEGVKYFSGHGTYTKTVDAPADWFKPGAQLWLDLGDVKNLAEVRVNGKDLGILWKAPYRLDVTSAMKPGENKLEIRVANLWVNRLIGDAQPNAAKKYTFTTHNPYKANSPLLPSGLLGAVQVIRVSSQQP